MDTCAELDRLAAREFVTQIGVIVYDHRYNLYNCVYRTEGPQSQLRQFFQGGRRSTAAVEQSVYLIHDRAQGPQLRQAARHLPQLPPLRRTEVMRHEQVAVLEQLNHPLLLSLGFPCLGLLLFAGPTTRLLGDVRGHLLAEFRQRVQHRQGDLFEDVELADLMPRVRPQLFEHLGVKRRSIRGDAAHGPLAFRQLLFELHKENANVVLRWVVVENPEGQTVVSVVIDDREDAEGAIVDLVDGQVTAEVSQRLVEVGSRQRGLDFFPQPSRPSFGWWRRGRRRGGPARAANWRCGRASHLRRPAGRPVAGRGRCTDSRVKPGRKYHRRSNSRIGGNDGARK